MPPAAVADHLRMAQERQLAVIRAMTPAQRWLQARRLNASMRRFLAAGFRDRHPDWTEEQVKQAVVERILHARTG